MGNDKHVIKNDKHVIKNDKHVIKNDEYIKVPNKHKKHKHKKYKQIIDKDINDRGNIITNANDNKHQNIKHEHSSEFKDVKQQNIHLDILYAKVTNKKELHYDLQYSTGLIKDIVPFNPNQSCGAGGIYFTTVDQIGNFLNHGCWIRIVKLPINNPDFQMVPDGLDKFKANMVIMGERYSLFDIETYKKFNLRLPNDMDMVLLASNNGEREVLEKLITEKNRYIYESISVNAAAINGYTSILDFWYSFGGMDMIGFCNCVRFAAINGQIVILKWCLRRGFCLRSFGEAITFAATNNQIKVLDWLFRCDYWKTYINSAENCFKSIIIIMSRQSNDTKIIDWLFDHNLISKYLNDNDYVNILALAVTNNNFKILEWWLRTGLVFYTLSHKLTYNEQIMWRNAIDKASERGYIKVLQALLKYEAEMQYSELALGRAYENKHKDVVIFWLKSGLKIKCSRLIMDRLEIEYFELF